MKIIIDYTRRKWMVLILVYIIYICTETFWVATVGGFIFDLIARPPLFRALLHKTNDISYAASVGVDVLIRVGLVGVGGTLNALFGFVFDLTFYRGMVGLLLGITLFLYAWFYMLPVVQVDYRVVDTKRVRKQKDEDDNDESESGDNGSLQSFYRNIDYVFLFILFAFLLCSTETYVFAEPWTFVTVYMYFISVVMVVVVGDISALWHWIAIGVFIVFWGFILAVTYQIDIQRKHGIKTYFI